MPDDELWFDWRENFVRTYMDSDLRTLGLNIRPTALVRLLRIIGSVNGSPLNYSDIAKSMDVSMPTLKNYIDYLEHAFIVRRLQPYFTSIGKRLIKSPKIYFRDTGNLHYLLNIFPPTEPVNHIIVGHSWEGFVSGQIIARRKKTYCRFSTGRSTEQKWT
jgi:predicted AAA+ superfamily ATPase